MKRTVSAALVLLSLLPIVRAAPAADATVQLLEGGGLLLDRYRGDKPLLLKFWASWCSVCLQQMPAYNELYERYGDRVQFLSVNAAINDPLSRARATAERYSMRMPVAYDEVGALWDRFDVIATPMYVLVDRDGDVAYTHYQHDENLELALDAVIASRSPETAGLEYHATPRAPADIDGQPIDLQPADDETLLVYHFATWCETYLLETDPDRIPRCREFREGIDRLAARDLPGLRIIGFATRNGIDAKSVRQYREQHGIEHQLVYDAAETFAHRFGVRDFPYLVVVRDGDVVHSSDRFDATVIQDLVSRRYVPRGARSAPGAADPPSSIRDPFLDVVRTLAGTEFDDACAHVRIDLAELDLVDEFDDEHDDVPASNHHCGPFRCKTSPCTIRR